MQETLDSIKDAIIKNGFLIGIALVILSFFMFLLTEDNNPLFIWLLLPGGIATLISMFEM